MKFIREAQKKLAKAVLRHKLQSQGVPVPSEAELERHSEQIVDEANRVLKSGGQRILAEIKDRYREATKKRGPQDR